MQFPEWFRQDFSSVKAQTGRRIADSSDCGHVVTEVFRYGDERFASGSALASGQRAVAGGAPPGSGAGGGWLPLAWTTPSVRVHDAQLSGVLAPVGTLTTAAVRRVSRTPENVCSHTLAHDWRSGMCCIQHLSTPVAADSPFRPSPPFMPHASPRASRLARMGPMAS